MDPKRLDRILEDWDAAASEARRPAMPPRRDDIRRGPSSASVGGATLVVIALVIAVAWLGRPGTNGGVGSIASAPASPSATPGATPSADTTATTPTPTPVPTIGPCDPAQLAVRVTLWEGAAGHRIADVELTNAGSSPCTVRAMSQPQLVDGHGSVLMDGSSPPTSGLVTVDPGDVLKTLVDTSNYCGPVPTAPVTVAFVLPGGGRILATPVSPTDATVPPCLALPGSAGEIQMQPWAH